jgi:hypothetical protein
MLRFTAPGGESRCHIRYQGGVLISVSDPAPLVGEPSKTIKIISAVYKPEHLTLVADVSRDAPTSTLELWTIEKPLEAQGGKLSLISPGVYRLAVDLPQAGPAAGEYRRVEINIQLAPGK